MKKFILLVFFSFACAIPSFAQTGAVTGVALDTVGNTVAGATITVCPQGSSGIPCSPVTASTTSNGQGAFSVIVPIGTYTVTVFRSGVVATSSTVVVAPSNITIANNVTYAGTVTYSSNVSFSSATFTGNNAFTGNNTHSGVETFKNINNVRFADQFAGADIGAKVVAALADLSGSPGVVVISPGTYSSFATGVTVSNPGQYIWCLGGKRATIFTPTSGFSGPLFTFSAGGVPLVQTGIVGCRFDGAGNSNQKTAILVVDVSQFKADEINVVTWSGSSSIGIQVKGREFINLTRNQIQADIPIDIEKNPDSSIAIDTTRFQDLYLLPSGTNPNINVGLNDLTSVIQHWRLDGVDMVGGQNGILVNDSTGTSAWLDIDLRNVHWEQQTGSGGFAVNWNRTTGHTNTITLNNVDAGNGNSGADGGFFFKNSFYVSGFGASFSGTSGTCVNVDNTNFDWTLQPFCQTGSTRTLNPSFESTGGTVYFPEINLGALTVDPAGAVAGSLFYRSDLTRLRYFDSSWHSIPGLDTTDTLTNKTLTSPTLTSPTINLLTNGTGLQVFNTTTTCTTAASVGATCTTAAISLPVAEADISYRVVCIGKSITNVPVVIATTNSSTTQFTITIAALTAAAATFSSYDCMAGHN